MEIKKCMTTLNGDIINIDNDTGFVKTLNIDY